MIMSVTILRRPEVEKLTGLSRSAIYESVGRGDLPRPIKITPKANGWILLELQQWLDKKILERDLAILEAAELEEMCA